MSELVLSRDEVRDLCRCRIKAKQVAFLTKNGITPDATKRGIAPPAPAPTA